MRHVLPYPAVAERRSFAVALFTSVALAACAVGPNYHRPPAANPQRFKEAEGWKPAEPREAASGTAWWSIYGDATLDELEKQIDISNQTLQASEAAWRQATALVSQARAGLFPTIGVTATGTRSGGQGGRANAAQLGGTVAPLTHPVNEFELLGSASWDIDIWGKIRRTIESDVANAQASEADLAAARLSAQATLATDYIELRVADEQKQLLDKTVEGYARSLAITENQYRVGVVAKADVITAQTQLEGAQSQQIAIGVTRATLEHAIAVLIGKAPADFSLPQATLGATVPVIPAGIPSALLERRPDIAGAERRMAAANAQIGVAIAAYFPDLTLTGTYGFASNEVSGLVSAPKSSSVSLAAAPRDQKLFGALRILEQQVDVQEQTVRSADLSVQLTLNQYRAGTVAYTSVVTAQAIALGDAQTLLTIRQNRLVASVALIQALGGGWNAASIGTRQGTAATLAAGAAQTH